VTGDRRANSHRNVTDERHGVQGHLVDKI